MRKIALIFIFVCASFQSGYAERFIPDSDLTKRVLDIVNQLYVDHKRIVPSKMLEGSLDNLSTSIAPVLTHIENNGRTISVRIRVDQFNREFHFQNPNSMRDLNDQLQSIMRFVKKHLEADEKPENVDYAIINGFLSQLDPHSSLLIPEIYSDFSTNTSGNFGGVGMMIGIRDGALTIIAPIDNTPASRIGLRAKDRIVQINEESTVNMSLTDAVKKLRGEKGTKVDVYIMRTGFTSPRKYTVVRDIIEITSVESHEFRDNKKRVGYIKVNTFQQNTMDEINSHLDDLDYDLKDFMGLVLDLRNNPGGLLDQAIRVSDRFLDEGVIVSTAGLKSNSIKSYKAGWLRSIEDIPLIVLVNNGSASASEIVAAALKNNNRAVVIGIQTFGKGSVQQVIPFSDGSALRLTTSKYLTPGNISIQSVGVTPHITVMPYFISNEYLHVTSPTLENAEKDLEQNFSEWGDKAEETIKTVYYLYSEEMDLTDPNDASFEDPKEVREEQIKKDFLIQSAVEILKDNNNGDYNQLLSKSLDYAEVLEKAQKQAVIDQFASFSTPINWKRYPDTPPGSIESNIWLEVKQSDNTWKKHTGPVQAENEIQLFVEVKNTGNVRVSKLLAITDCENRVFDDRQFAFGKLEPGESQKWYIPIKISESTSARDNLIHFTYTDQQERKILKKTFALVIEEKDKPLLSYTLTPFENGEHESVGNGDNRLQVGETVTIKLDLTNTGKGISGPLTLIFRNGEGENVYLKRGRQTTSETLNGKTQTSYFQFDLKGIPQDQDLDFSLDIIDATYPQASLKHKLKIPLYVYNAAIINTPPLITLRDQDLLTDKKTYTFQGNIEDPENVKDIYVFQNKKKVFYKNFSAQSNRNKVEFSLTLDLEEENNRIVFVARDNDNVISHREVYLRYSDAM